MDLKTGYSLPRMKGDISYGDVLKSQMTHDVVVMYHEEKKIPIVKIIDDSIWFTLEGFIDAWKSRLEISHNMIKYSTHDD